MYISKRLKHILLACLFVLIVACSKVTQENFEKIKPGMSMTETVAILGEPSHSESINIGGISGTSAIWKDNNGEIDIQFLNDKVVVKSFSKPTDHKKEKTTISA